MVNWRRVIGKTFLFAGLAGWFFLAVVSAHQSGSADLIVVGARVVTMDAAQPIAEALAVTGARITAVGESSAIRRLAGPRTRIIDAGGKLVLPGFNDAHVHFLGGGRQLSGVDLRDARSPQELAQRLADFVKRLPAGTWITGGDWDHENWPGAPLPTRGLIDAATADHPVLVQRLDGHMALANSVALKLGGVTRDTPDPDGGMIVRDGSGEPTGVLKDAAMGLVSARIPPLSFDERLAAARAATNHAAKLGVTSVQDMSGENEVPIYRELLRRGELKTRIYAAAPLPSWRRSAAGGLTAAQGDSWIRQGALKGFADGSLGSTTAYFFQPYRDAPATRGLPSDEMFPEGAMFQRVIGADRAGLHVMIHAIGDRANDEILAVYEQAIRENGARDRRFRIEHAQHLRLADIPRFTDARVIASMQPYHCADDGRWAEKRIGADRAKGTYAFRSLLDHGVVLAFGSDWNVAPLDPLRGLIAAVSRQTLDGQHPDGWVPEQKISMHEAVRAYTVGSAYAELQEQEKGTLTVGKLADFVLLSHDLFTVSSDELGKVRVVMTVVDGCVVFESAAR